MADFAANRLFTNLQSFKERYITEEKRGKENDAELLMAMSQLLSLDLRFTFNPISDNTPREIPADTSIGFHMPTK
jgi:hypothetical protein